MKKSKIAINVWTSFAIIVGLSACNPPKQQDAVVSVKPKPTIAVAVLEDRSLSFSQYKELAEDTATHVSDFVNLYENVKINGGYFAYAQITGTATDPFITYQASKPSMRPGWNPSKVNPLKLAEYRANFVIDLTKYKQDSTTFEKVSFIKFEQFLVAFRSTINNRTHSKNTNIYDNLARTDRLLKATDAAKKYILIYSDGINDVYTQTSKFINTSGAGIILINPAATNPNKMIKVEGMKVMSSFSEAVDYVVSNQSNQ
jgi:hypothetical protein